MKDWLWPHCTHYGQTIMSLYSCIIHAEIVGQNLGYQNNNIYTHLKDAWQKQSSTSNQNVIYKVIYMARPKAEA